MKTTNGICLLSEANEYVMIVNTFAFKNGIVSVFLTSLMFQIGLITIATLVLKLHFFAKVSKTTWLHRELLTLPSTKKLTLCF